MAGYQITITNSEGSIELSSNDNKTASIRSVDFKINTLDDGTRNRADDIRAEIVIKGTIYEENKDNTRKLALWAIDEDQKTLYRDVEVVVNQKENLTGDVLRRYSLSNMFVIDYEEVMSEKNDCLDFTLFLAQKENEESIKIFAI